MMSTFIQFAAADCSFNGSIEDMVLNWLNPLIIAVKANKNYEDDPNWNQAMNGQFSQEYWYGACTNTEIETLEKMDSW